MTDEPELRAKSEVRFLTSLLDEADVGIWSISHPALLTLHVNEALLRITGRPRDAFLVDRPTMIPWLHPDDQARGSAQREETFAAGVSMGTYRLLRPDGELRWIRFYGHMVRGEDGELERLDACIIDITEARQTEEALRESRAKLAAALDAMHDLVIITDAQGRVVESNEAFARFRRSLGRETSPGDLSGWRANVEVSRPDGAPEGIEQWAIPRALRGERALNVESVIRRKDTGEAWTRSVSFGPIRDSTGTIVGAVVVGRDVTEQKQAEAALAEARAATALAEGRERRRIAEALHDQVGQALALTEIRLGTLLDRLSGADRSELVECMGALRTIADDVRGLTFELDPPILRDLGLKAAIDWLAEELASPHGIEVRVEGDDLSDLDGDVATLLFRAARELLINVIKHAQTTRAEVWLTRAAREIVVEVSDYGVGFGAVVNGLPRSPGYGLASIREQMGLLGGTVEIGAPDEGGSRVRLRVPIAAAFSRPRSTRGGSHI